MKLNRGSVENRFSRKHILSSHRDVISVDWATVHDFKQICVYINVSMNECMYVYIYIFICILSCYQFVVSPKLCIYIYKYYTHIFWVISQIWQDNLCVLFDPGLWSVTTRTNRAVGFSGGFCCPAWWEEMATIFVLLGFFCWKNGTFLKFNIAPENKLSQKESNLPTNIFRGLC